MRKPEAFGHRPEGVVYSVWRDRRTGFTDTTADPAESTVRIPSCPETATPFVSHTMGSPCI